MLHFQTDCKPRIFSCIVVTNMHLLVFSTEELGWEETSRCVSRQSEKLHSPAPKWKCKSQESSWQRATTIRLECFLFYKHTIGHRVQVALERPLLVASSLSCIERIIISHSKSVFLSQRRGGTDNESWLGTANQTPLHVRHLAVHLGKVCW